MSIQDEANRQDNEQLNYESDYYPLLLVLFSRINKYIKSTIKNIDKSNININIFRDDFEKILQNIYSRVQNGSIDKLYSFITNKELLEADKNSILFAMENQNNQNIQDNLFYLLSTTKKDISKFISEYRNITIDQELHNYVFEKLENLKSSRSLIISHRNVSLSYESLKNTIANHHSRTTGLTAKKIWVTMDDDKVRLSHREANRQEVPLNGLYIVQDQLLKYPKDMSHGASLDNVINCRCLSIPLFN